MAGTRKVFPTKFVWDHGGSEVCLVINGGPPVKLQKEEDGTLTDISLFTMDSGKEPKSGVQASIMPVLVSASPDFSRSGILRRENIHHLYGCAQDDAFK